MKADASALPGLPIGNKTAANVAVAGKTRRDDDGADAGSRFDRLLHKSPAAERTRATDAARERPAANAGKDGSAASQSASTQAASTQAAAAQGAVKAERDLREARDDESPLPAEWPPAGLILPVLLPPLPADAAPVGTAATAPETVGNGLPATTGGSLRLPPWTGGDTAAPATALPIDDLVTAAADASAAPEADPLAPARAGKALPAATPALPSAAASTLAAPAEPAALPLPAGFVLFKDSLDALTPGKREDVATLAAPAFSGAAPLSDNGLARTATVNPLTSLTPDLNTDQFGETLGTQLTWMAEQKVGHAHIRISPHDMGTIEVNLRLDGDRVHADFSSAQPEVRQALESSLPRLRDMLGQQGFQLAQADVGHRQNPQSPPPGQGTRAAGDGAPSTTDGTAAGAPVVRIVRGLVDAYA